MHQNNHSVCSYSSVQSFGDAYKFNTSVYHPSMVDYFASSQSAAHVGVKSELGDEQLSGPSVSTTTAALYDGSRPPPVVSLAASNTSDYSSMSSVSSSSVSSVSSSSSSSENNYTGGAYFGQQSAAYYSSSNYAAPYSSTQVAKIKLFFFVVVNYEKLFGKSNILKII